ncbi:MAG: pyridoxal-phosphate-dependent aminotransferase family protein [Shimia sp.]|uniref:pyridoxal-phosphate-dependent aminotransferase family protein n=1 Tax=Shimia sp. TaxID=1954381 RepID=UPI004058A9DF
MRYFSIGPVQMSKRVMEAGGQQAAYFRDQDFADKVISAQNSLLQIVGADSDSKIAIMSGSGSAAMEAAVTNFTSRGDPVLVINGGSFGQRFVDIVNRYARTVTDFSLPSGRDIDLDQLETSLKEHTPVAVFMNIHETSTGQLYDVRSVAKLCQNHQALLVCDAVSTLASDPLNMADMGIDVLLFSSNKGLALAPGAAFLIAGKTALSRLACSESYYLDLAPYFSGAVRGQPPVTSSIGVLQQLFERLDEIEDAGGISQIIARVEANALAFRSDLSDMGIKCFPETPSNAITAFVLEHGNSNEFYEFLKNKHELIINKSAWGMNADVPRIAHVGDLGLKDHKDLIHAVKEFLECT